MSNISIICVCVNHIELCGQLGDLKIFNALNRIL